MSNLEAVEEEVGEEEAAVEEVVHHNMTSSFFFISASVSGTITETTTITCADPITAPQSFIWTFNHSQVIMNHTDHSYNIISEGWRPYVKEVTDTGSLTLQDLSLDQTGVYTCELSNAERTHVTNTFLQLREGTSQGDASAFQHTAQTTTSSV